MGKRNSKSSFGPGFLVAAAFIGPGTVTSCSLAGARFGYALIFALIFAVPHISPKKRLRIFLLGFGIIFVLHLFKIFVFVKGEYSRNIKVGGVPYWSTSQQYAYRYLGDFILLVANQILPILIWSLLYVKYWWDKRTRSFIR